MKPTRSYLVCATPRSGSTLVCKALRDTGVAGRPEEYFEALRSTGRPRRPSEYFEGVDDRSIFDELGEQDGEGSAPPPAWSRTAYDRYLDWAMEQGTTDNGVFGAKLMWQYLGDFVGLLRNVPDFRHLPLPELLPAAFPDTLWTTHPEPRRWRRRDRRVRDAERRRHLLGRLHRLARVAPRRRRRLADHPERARALRRPGPALTNHPNSGG